MENSGASVQPQQETPMTGFQKFKAAVGKTDSVINLILVWMFRLRKFVLAAPVVYYALKIAQYNREHLPEQVGRGMAVNGCLALTLGCLVLMFFSRKATYTWTISVLTLALPLLLLLSNVYPA